MNSPKNFLSLLFVVAILSGLLVGQQDSERSAAEVPRLVNYSGKVTDAKGIVLSGLASVTFSIYKDQVEGAPLWIETQNVQADAKGAFTAQLGATKGEGLPLDLFTSGEARWLGVRVNGGEEQPRVMLLSVPYALKAGDSQTLGGLPASAFVLAAPPNGGGPAADSTSVINGNGPIPAVTGTGTADYLPLWTSSSGALGNSVLFQSGTGTTSRIGINTAAPASTLDVKGAATVRGTLSLPTTGAATATTGKNSQPLSLTASVFNSSIGTAVNQTFRLQSETVGNNTSNATGSLSFLYGSGANPPAETGLKIASNGKITFAAGQTFPGSGSVTSVSSGLGLTGGPITRAGTLSIDTSVVPQLAAANTFTTNQTVNGNITATGTITGRINSYYITSPYISGINSANNAAVTGENSNPVTSSSGVLGLSYAASGTTYAVLGQNYGGANNIGTLGAGVFGLAGLNRSVTGSSLSSRAGVQGDGGNTNSWGVLGTADSNAAGTFYNNGGGSTVYTLVARNLDGPPLFVTNQANGSGCWVDAGGSINCTGSKNAVVPVDGGQHRVALSAIESPMNWFEDFGSEQLASGAAIVSLKADFAQTVNTQLEYYVFLTPRGDCKGLYVTNQTPNSFEVRELGDGASSVKFDYRIVALRKNFEPIRMADHTHDLDKLSKPMSQATQFSDPKQTIPSLKREESMPPSARQH